MGKKWFVVGGVAIIVVAVALYAGLVIYPASRFRTALGQVQQFLPAGTSLSYQAADYSLFSDRASITGVSLRNSGPLAAALTIDKIALERPSLKLGNEWQRAKSNPKALAQDAAIPIAAAITFSGITIRTDKVTEKIGSAQIDQPRLYPRALLHPGVPTWTEALAVLKTEPPPKSLSAFMPLLRFEAALALGVGYSGAAATDINATAEVPAAAGMPAHAVTYSIAKTDGPANDRGVFGAGSAEYVVLQLGPPAGTMTIDRMAVSGLNARQPLEKILAHPRLTPAVLDGLAFGRIKMAGMALKPPKGPAIALGTFALSRIAVSDGIPVSAQLAWNGLRLTRAEMPDAKARLAFEQLGLDSMTISLDAAYNWELPASRLAIQDIRLNVAELGSLSLSASLIGVAPSRDAFDRASLAHAVLRYRDGSLIARSLKAAAVAMHADPAQFRHQLIAMVQGRMSEFGDSPAIAHAAKAIITFLDAPQSLTIELAPPAPVPLTTLRNSSTMAPPELASLLGLQVTANQ
ncbi:MAG: hypothetical protein ACREFU_02920 [Acetobacteraceae bacterium]